MHATQVGNGEVGTHNHVGASGAVNFDNNLVSQSASQEQRAADAVQTEQSTLGNVVGISVSAKPAEAPAIEMHTISVAIHLTLNTGYTFLKGLKGLKSVDVQHPDGSITNFNFHNPFMKADKERQTGEGLMRKVFGSIAKIAHSTLGRPAMYLGDSESDMSKHVSDLAEATRKKLVAQFPCPPSEQLFVVPTEVGGVTVERPVCFSELFDVQSWVSSSTDDSNVTTHVVYFNIGLNIGALYDSKEPHTFVRKAYTFLESQMSALGLQDLIEFHVNYAFDSTTLMQPEMRDLLDVLTSEDGYTLISKSSVANEVYAQIPSNAADKLFGYGCDLILTSPTAVSESEE